MTAEQTGARPFIGALSRCPAPRPAVDPELWYRAIHDTPLLLAGIADLDGRIVDANHLSVEGVGYRRADVIGALFWEGPWWGDDAAVRDRVRAWCTEAARLGALVRGETVWWRADGAQRYVDAAVHPLVDERGRPAYLFLSGLDITERVRARRAAATGAAQAADALQEIADERAESIRVLRAAESKLAASLQLSRHILDNVADGIYGLDRDMRGMFVNPSATKIVGYSQDELLGKDIHGILHRRPDGSPCPPDECPAVRAMRSGDVVGYQREVFRRADGTLLPVELVAVPTISDGVVTSVVVSFRDLTDRLLAEEQSQQLLVLAQREAVQRVLSDRLQRALLTPPPQLPGLAVAVRYRPAAAEAQIGGDWYDAFVQPDGATMLAVGDVVGHDSSAASAMAQLRGLLRGVAYGWPGGPAAVLSRFEVAAAGLGVNALATTVLARVSAPGGGAVAGCAAPRRVVWCSAGHLPPVLLDAVGSVTVLRRPADVLLGIDDTAARHEHELELTPGSALIFFTDGLIERRFADIDDGLAELTAALRDLAAETDDLDALCDQLLARLLPADADDDVALLAVRVSDDQ